MGFAGLFALSSVDATAVFPVHGLDLIATIISVARTMNE